MFSQLGYKTFLCRNFITVLYIAPGSRRKSLIKNDIKSELIIIYYESICKCGKKYDIDGFIKECVYALTIEGTKLFENRFMSPECVFTSNV